MKHFLFILIAAASLTSCSKWCNPDKIMSGESNRHHDTKKFRVMWTKQYGKNCLVRMMNMNKQFNTLCLCDCDTLPVGKFITVN